MNTSLISICIPTYNGQKFLGACINSAISQSYQNIEIVIVDDCSTDGTRNIITDYANRDSRIKIFKNEANLGLVGNWNRCIELASGSWIKFLFQDDYLAVNCLEVMVAAMEPEDKIIASMRAIVIDESSVNYNDKRVTFEKLRIKPQKAVSITPGEISGFAVQHIGVNFLGEPTAIMFKREIVNELGIFNPNLIQICDLEYFLRITTNYGIKYCPKVLSYFRIHGDSTSSFNTGKKIYRTNNIDPVVLVNELLYAPFFAHFRKRISFIQKIRLVLFFRVRLYESYKNALILGGEEFSAFTGMEHKYATVSRFKKGTILIRILYLFVRLKRIFTI